VTEVERTGTFDLPASEQPDDDLDPHERLSMLRACAEAGVSRRTLYNWIEAGKLPYSRTAGGAIRVRRGDLFTPVMRRTQP
jgi:excisionase family DNA binding protein